MNLCKLEGCEKITYAKGYCRNHYEYKRRTGNIPKIKKYKSGKTKCIVDNCNSLSNTMGYCNKHYARNRKYGNPLTLKNIKGEKNPRWNGGISDYPNHHLMKKNRKIAFEKANNKCIKCGNPGKVVHHKDGSKTNHSLENLMVLCYKCHTRQHNDSPKKPRKYSNYNLLELSKKIGVSTVVLLKYFNKKKLTDRIINIISKKIRRNSSIIIRHEFLHS